MSFPNAQAAGDPNEWYPFDKPRWTRFVHRG